jgi:hypothetical protein
MVDNMEEVSSCMAAAHVYSLGSTETWSNAAYSRVAVVQSLRHSHVRHALEDNYTEHSKALGIVG